MITNNSSSTPWVYEKFDSLMAKVKDDLRYYNESNLIQNERYYNIIEKCNATLGEKIHQSRICKIKVQNYKAPIPKDLYKIENMFATCNSISSSQFTSGFIGRYFVHSNIEDNLIPQGEEKIMYLGRRQEEDCNEVDVSVVTFDTFKDILPINQFFPLELSPFIDRFCTPYSPCKSWKGKYSVDLNDEEFTFGFESGEVILQYLGDLIDEEGNLLYPFHPKLNDYYEYSVKERILEDIFLNSEADVSQKYQLIRELKSEARSVAWAYIQSAKANQWSMMRKRREQQFYKEWVKMFK